MADQANTMAFTTIEAYVDGPIPELEKLGLQVTVRLPALKVRSPAVAGTDPRGTMLSSSATRDIPLLDRDGHGLGRYWVGPGMRPGERDGAPRSQEEVWGVIGNCTPSGARRLGCQPEVPFWGGVARKAYGEHQ
jgi:hypothetical protein